MNGAPQRRGAGSRYAIAVATFYRDLADRLIAGALGAFEAEGVGEGEVDVYEVPGCFELPLAAKMCAETGSYSAVACLGAVLRGETDHYDFVCRETAAGIRQVGLETGVPCSFGVITCDEMAQAVARADGSKRDQGQSAALAAVQMARTKGRVARAR